MARGAYIWRGDAKDYDFWNSIIGFEEAIYLEAIVFRNEFVARGVRQQVEGFLRREGTLYR